MLNITKGGSSLLLKWQFCPFLAYNKAKMTIKIARKLNPRQKIWSYFQEFGSQNLPRILWNISRKNHSLLVTVVCRHKTQLKVNVKVRDIIELQEHSSTETRRQIWVTLWRLSYKSGSKNERSEILSVYFCKQHHVVKLYVL